VTYAAAREGSAVALLGERGVLAVTGPDRQKFLHNVLSNDVSGRIPGRGALAALMDVKGHVLALMRVLVTQDAVLLEMPKDRLAPVESILNHYKVAAPVRFAVRPTAVIGIVGPKAADAIASAGGTVPETQAEAHVAARIANHEVLVARASDLPARGFVLHVAPDGAGAVVDALKAAGAAPLDAATLDILRIEDGRPWYGPDVTEENLLHETGLVGDYHSPTKGCYVGQEVVARLEARGANVNKRLRGLRLGAAADAGAPILSDGREVGRVTTAAASPRLGPIALGYVQRSQSEPGTAVLVGGAPATVVSLPMD
jgi:folate-binding protein YgfZ